jgi:hypothetical protein
MPMIEDIHGNMVDRDLSDVELDFSDIYDLADLDLDDSSYGEMLENVTAFNDSGGIAGAINRNINKPRNIQPVEPEPESTDNTLLYVGIGVAVLLLTKR